MMFRFFNVCVSLHGSEKPRKAAKGPKNKKKTVVRCKKKQQQKKQVVSVVKLHHLLWQIFLKFNLKNKRVRYESIN